MKRIIQAKGCAVALGIILTCGVSCADETGSHNANSTSSKVADLSLGRLFFTPTERNALDSLRRNPMSVGPAQDASTEASAIVAERIVVNGIVAAGTHARAVWLNDQRQTDNPAPGMPRALSEVSDLPRVPVLLPERGDIVQLKVGESYDPYTGAVAEPPASEATGAISVSNSASP